MGEIYEVVVFTASLSKVSNSFTKYASSSLLWTPFPKYADPVLDKLDIHQVVAHRLFRESCYNHKGNYVKVCMAYFNLVNILSILSIGPVTIRTAHSGHNHPG